MAIRETRPKRNPVSPVERDLSYVGRWARLDGSIVDGDDDDPAFVIAHLSDLHGQLGPRHQVYYDNETARPPLDFNEADRRIRPAGGVPLLASKLQELREGHDEVLTLMSGDTFHGSAHATYTRGESMVGPVNDHLKPDVYVPGNWDFEPESAEDGKTLDLLDSLDATVLANNLYDWETDDRLFGSYTIKSVNGHDVGIVGMTNVYVDRMPPAFHEGKYRFGKHPALLERTARRAREAGADIVVAVTEIGLQWSVQAAKDCPSVDVICSAHTHEYTYDPILVADTLVIESGVGDALGRIDLRSIDDELQFRHVLYCLVRDHDYTPEPDSDAEQTVREIHEPFLAGERHERGHGTLERPVDTVVGESETALTRQAFLESEWNALFNDALVASLGTDIAISHGFRFGTALNPGEITLADLYTCFPMTAPVARGDAYGKQITEHVERYLVDNFSPHVYDQEDGRVRSFSSNVEITIDPTAKRGRRLRAFRIDGEPIDPDESYSVATLRESGAPTRVLGGCRFPFRNIHIEEGVTPVDIIVAYLEEQSPIAYTTGGIVETADDGGSVQNTPADGPYPFVQPGVDSGDSAYAGVAMVPKGYAFSEEGVNRLR